jgi:hypothetical protein
MAPLHLKGMNACGKAEGQNMVRERTAKGKMRRRARTEKMQNVGHCWHGCSCREKIQKGCEQKFKNVSKQLKTVSVLRSFY